MKAIVSSFGSAGDVRPLLGVAWALKHSGHEVVCLLDPAWCERARRTLDVEAVAFGASWDSAEIARRPEWLDPKRGSVRMLRELVIPRTGDLVEVARRVCADLKPDVIIGHHISFGLPWVADEAGVPWVMCAVAPSSWPSVDDPNLYPGMPDRESYPRWTIRLGAAVAGRVIDRAIDPAINSVRRDLGLAPQKRTMLGDQFSRVRNLGLWSEHFRAPAGDDPSGAVITGFPRLPDDLSLPEDILASIEAARSGGQPVGVWTLGTTAVHSGSALRDGFVDACRERDVCPVVLTGDEKASEILRSQGLLSRSYLPHDAILPLADFAVHHAGIGSSAAALRAGIPSIAIPFTHDQPDNARRLRRLGVASVLKPKDHVEGDPKTTYSARFDDVFDRSAVQRAKEFGQHVDREDWERNVVRAIELVA